jgi:mono/diheme cytochrome c family protein
MDSFGHRAPAGLIAAALLAAFSAHAGADVSLPKTVQFNRDIRPILADNCYSCHGPDKDKRKAKLRLDTKDGLFTANKDAAPIVPGKPDQSDIYRRILSHDPDEVMPQSKTGKTLSAQQIALIKRWIEQGAKWEGHWAYNPLVRPAPPEVKHASWVKNPIDNFILARLQTEGLRPSPEADKRTLIRRLSFDLTGLPPKPEEAQAFIADKSPNAYEKLVDRQLASPHYGERMAVEWLDAVRYADTDGFHADNYRSVYPYRDYVIDAFNADMPFDRFTVEQLAGDLLPHATTAQKIASTYNRLNRTTEEGGAQAKEYLVQIRRRPRAHDFNRVAGRDPRLRGMPRP